MSESIENIRLLLEEITIQCDANWIAFSGGLDSSILAQIKKDQGLNAITIIAKDFLGTDLPYSQIAAKHIDIPLELKYVNIDEMLSAIESTIKILKNFNDIEIRNSIVPYLYLNTLKEKFLATNDPNASFLQTISPSHSLANPITERYEKWQKLRVIAKSSMISI